MIILNLIHMTYFVIHFNIILRKFIDNFDLYWLIFDCDILPIFFSIKRYRGKKNLKIFTCPWTSTSKILLVLLPNNLSLSRKNILALSFLLVRRTLGEHICLSCLKFNLSRAPGQVIFLPLRYYMNLFIFSK